MRPVADTLREIAAVGSDSFARSLGWYSGDIAINPDPILRGEAGGRATALYEEMEAKDPALFSDLQTRKLAVAGLPWEVIAAGPDAADKDVATWVAGALRRIPGFVRDLRQLLDAVGKGFAVSEIMWGLDADGRVSVADIRSRNQRRFAFTTENELRLLCDANTFFGVAVPPRKFLVHSFGDDFESGYGRGLLSRCYWYWWFKKKAVKFWALFSEKFGSPTVVGKYPPGTDDQVKRKLLSALQSIQQETALTIPDNIKAEFLEARPRGNLDTYDGFILFLEKSCTKAILGQTLTSGEGQRSGSLALGRVHAEVRQDLLEADGLGLQDTINGQLVRWLVDWNFTVTAYPTWTLKTDPPEDLNASVVRDGQLQAMGVALPKSYVQRRYGIPDPEGPDDVLQVPAGAARPPTGLGPNVVPQGFAESGAMDRIMADTDRLLAASEARGARAMDGLARAVLDRIKK
jgi:phage gp29-like protein